MDKILYIGLGGFVGANLRYFVSTWLTTHLNAQTFFATMFINVSGSFLLGAFLAWADSQLDLPSQIRLLIATGFFGAYTTFSTYAVESVALGRVERWDAFLFNIIISNALSLFGAWLGFWLVQR